MDAVDRLGRRVSRMWTRVGRTAETFSAVSAAALRAQHAELDVRSFVRRLFAGGAIPPQTSLTEAFGEPPLTLYRERDFYVEALFWHTGTTGVHEHRFCGAFLVAEAESLETRYRFTERRVFGDGFALGDLALVGADVLARGEVREIQAGGGLIHSVFHLGAPSVTLVVRTHSQPGLEREYRYPHVALDPAARDPRTVKQLQILNLMARTGWGDYTAAACDAIANANLVGGFLVASRARLHLPPAAFERVAARLRRRHGALAAPLLRVVDEERRKWLLVTLRQSVTSAEARFFLGVLLNVPDRAGVLAALAQRFPAQDPRVCLAVFKRALAPFVRGYSREVYTPLMRVRGGV